MECSTTRYDSKSESGLRDVVSGVSGKRKGEGERREN